MKYSTLLIAILLFAGCGKKTGSVPTPEPANAPAKAVLVSPAQNEACNTGTVISATQSTVQFKWNKSENTDTYEVSVKNLETGVTTTHPAAGNTQLGLTLSRNTPYSWRVTSKSSTSSSTATSDTWKFYNSGPSSVFYAPFPADALSPAMGANVTATGGKVNLSWTGSDADNDITSYDVYFGTTNTPAVLSSSVTATSLANVTVSANTTYYWKVVTKDSKGNTSDSGIYQFKVN